jgi:hypothetical protein
MTELEMEIKKQRDRTVSLLAEKDRELEFYKHQNFEGNPYYPHLRNPPFVSLMYLSLHPFWLVPG